jgi:hypothetical protein
MAEYVSFDIKTETVNFALPEEHKNRSAEILDELKVEFGYESITPDLIFKMNASIKQKLNDK